jgi:hypothetical protein
MLLCVLECKAFLAVIGLTGLAKQAAGPRWESTVDAFFKLLSLIVTVWSGLTLTLIEPGRSKRMLAGILFGLGMLIAAVNLLSISIAGN